MLWMMISKDFETFFLLLLLVYYSHGLLENIEDEDVDDEAAEEALPLEGDIGAINIIEEETENNTTPFIDRSSEEWVRDAVLDVAYYLRSHKFNDFDRRYFSEPNGDASLQYNSFPSPPLRYLHWEVYRYCDLGFYDCLAYLQDTVLKAELVRSLDTNVLMNQRHWDSARNNKSINKVDQECNRLKELDWRNGDPFKGPLERFQWRVSASYYMCYFTMFEYSPLIMFGERCDNYASCLEGGNPRNGDPRADDSKPFQCAMYSFCPEVCCPLKKIQGMDECLDANENPCYWQKDRQRRVCVFQRERNRDLVALALNEWNVTCHCDIGFEWDSMYGMCVDIDECSTGNHTCNALFQTCINLKGHFGCVCAWGYINITGTCMPNLVLSSALAGLHYLYHPPPTKPPRPFSFINYLSNLLFSSKANIETTTEYSLLKNDTDGQVTLPQDY